MNKPWCFGGLDCDEEYKCPHFEECGESLVKEIHGIPVEVCRIYKQVRASGTAQLAWKVRAKK